MDRDRFFTADHPGIDDEADSWLVDSDLQGLVTIEGDRLTLHDVALVDKGLHGARSGGGRRAMTRLRPFFDEIVVDGAIVEEDGEERVLQFWGAMLREGLIDVMILAQCDRRITREDIGSSVPTARGVVFMTKDSIRLDVMMMPPSL